MVSEYTGYNFIEIEDLNVLEYWLLLRDAVVYNCSQTEDGRKYLDDCWRMEQTEPDRQGLREHFKKN